MHRNHVDIFLKQPIKLYHCLDNRFVAMQKLKRIINSKSDFAEQVFIAHVSPQQCRVAIIQRFYNRIVDFVRAPSQRKRRPLP